MNKRYQSVSDAAAALADDPEVKSRVDAEIRQSAFVKALLQFRVAKGLSQKDLADRMGCDPSKISRLESGNDLQLKWGDVLGYLSALGVEVNVLLRDESLPAAEQIKQHVFAIHQQLERLAQLAQQVDDDEEIVGKIRRFYGEVLFNFVVRFADSYQRLPSTICVEPAPAPHAPAQKQRGSKERKRPQPAHSR